MEAIKLVYASAFFRAARTYRRAIGAADRDEKMAVLIQEVVGTRFGDRFYPHVSAVCRSFSLLVGFGRWGSSDPWLGVPVTWGQVAGARVIVEATLPELRIEPSQGSHSFHNVSSLGVVYFSTNAAEPVDLDWERLGAREAVSETEFLRHVRLETPLLVKVDGRSGRGFVRWGPETPGGAP
ncbi:MAG: PEP/pyruvate-binding domain-containing protein [Longimicrobiales bacterium]|nr:PEP/pyruvate-binding domain-containing protein [Longimicrobiales bacterium]